MDLSAFIFVALAVAWAVYLVPKALKHHDEVVRSRSVDRFSQTMRVLARREPVGSLGARLVVTSTRRSAASTETSPVIAVEVPAAPTPAQTRARREMANRAARRRRKVLGALALANVALVVAAAFSLLGWPYVAIPGVLLAGWLVACRLMVRGEDAAGAPSARMPIQADDEDQTDTDGVPVAELDDTSTMAAVANGDLDPALWDPVPVTLPTYVNKPVATRRTVRTIDLDDSGVWTSGNTTADSQIAREAEAVDKAARGSRERGDGQRAVGS